jgi:uncharacterized protein
MFKIKWFSVLVLVLIGATVVLGCASPAPAPDPAPTSAPAPAPAPAPTSDLPPKPEMFTWSTVEVGTSGYVQYAAAAEGIYKKFGIKVRVLPFPGSNEGVMATKAGISQVFTTNPGVLYAQEAMYDNGARHLGPEPVRVIWQANKQIGTGLLTVKDSPINTTYDLKGKKVVFFIGNPGMQTYVDVGLAFAGLTWDDVIKVEVSGLTDAKTALFTGKVDVIMAMAKGGYAMEIAAAPSGIKWLSLPLSDKEGWARLQKQFPFYYPVVNTTGAGITEQNPVELYSVSYPNIYCMKYSVSDDEAYWMAKAINESFDEFKDIVQPEMELWSIDNFFETSITVPFHEGAVKYFKEIGRWSEELEKKQAELLAHQDLVRQAWEEAGNEADELQLKAKDWAAFWEKKRVEKIPGALLPMR